jgi:hypothetical protein
MRSQLAFRGLTVGSGGSTSSRASSPSSPINGWFTEGLDTLDLKEAKALLDELHA